MNAQLSSDDSYLKDLFMEQPFFLAAGVFYGFPICCISDFVQMKQFAVFEKHPDLPSNGTGYVPCMECATKVMQNWDGMIKKISQQRICSVPFPGDHNDGELDLFFIHFCRTLGFNPAEVAEGLSFNKNIKKLLRQEKKELKEKKQAEKLNIVPKQPKAKKPKVNKKPIT